MRNIQDFGGQDLVSEDTLLKDSYGRIIRYMRVSVTDRCNFACKYCRDEKMPFIPHSRILRYEEIEELIRIAVQCGVLKLRFTGGEPFVRRGFMDFLIKIRKDFPKVILKVTSNGTLLGEYLQEIKKLDIAVNMSLDTLNREKFALVTGQDQLSTVLKNMDSMLDLHIPLKINAVAMHGVNDTELSDMASLVMDNPIHVRFIEFMPMGENTIWSQKAFFSEREILESISKDYRLSPVISDCSVKEKEGGFSDESGPARLWRLNDLKTGKISKGCFGIISSVTHGFCRSCNRLRLTADGHLRTCLFDDREYAVREALRRLGGEAVRKIMFAAVAKKPIGAEILARRCGPVAKKKMSAIGG